MGTSNIIFVLWVLAGLLRVLTLAGIINFHLYHGVPKMSYSLVEKSYLSPQCEANCQKIILEESGSGSPVKGHL